MSITNVHVAINRYLQNITCDIYGSETYVDGELVKTYTATGVTKKLAVFPLTNRDMRFLEQGQYTFQDKKVYEIGAGTLTDKSIITHDGSKYLIDGGTKRNFEGGYTIYISKKISD